MISSPGWGWEWGCDWRRQKTRQKILAVNVRMAAHLFCSIQSRMTKKMIFDDDYLILPVCHFLSTSSPSSSSSYFLIRCRQPSHYYREHVIIIISLISFHHNTYCYLNGWSCDVFWCSLADKRGNDVFNGNGEIIVISVYSLVEYQFGKRKKNILERCFCGCCLWFCSRMEGLVGVFDPLFPLMHRYSGMRCIMYLWVIFMVRLLHENQEQDLLSPGRSHWSAISIHPHSGCFLLTEWSNCNIQRVTSAAGKNWSRTWIDENIKQTRSGLFHSVVFISILFLFANTVLSIFCRKNCFAVFLPPGSCW